MSEIKRVLAAARQDLIPTLARHGFVRHRTTGSFFREVGELVQIVALFGTRSGGSFSVAVDLWAPAFSEGECAPSRSELASRRWIGGQLAPWRVDTGNWGWPIASDEQLADDLRQIAQHIEQVALPWFAQLSDPTAVARAVPLHHQPVDIVNQLQALGDRQLVERMRALGFRHDGPPLNHFVRERGSYVQVIAIESVGCAVQANLWIHVATKWTALAVYDSPREPHEPWFPANGGLLGSSGIDEGQMAWLVQGPDAVTSTVPALLAAIETHALPWFDATSMRDAYLLSIRSDRLPVDRRARLLTLLRNKLPPD